jgi:hypothetical protein
MNDTITIKEGNITRRLAPIDKLKVNTTDNKDSMWVSTGNANTGVLHASENGIYIASEDGYEAYSEVIVRVTKDSYEGDTTFDDWDYETPDMDLDNWDPGTIEEFENDPEGFDEVFNDEDEWKDIDKPIEIKMDNPKIQDTKISGIDPVTGNEMEVGLDENGYLTESTLPSSIKIEVPPDKLQYVEGQTIIFRGMVVKAYKADGNIWTDVSHSDGVIQHSELTFPITIAIRGNAYGEASIENQTIKYQVGGTLNITGHDERYNYDFSYTYSGYDYIAFFDQGTNVLFECLVTSTKDIVVIFDATYDGGRHSESVYHVEASGRTQINHIPYGYSGFATNAENIGIPWDIVQPPWKNNPYDFGTVLLDGNKSETKGQTVPVQYIRSDGEVLEDSFTIEVLPDPDGAHPQVDTSTVEWNHRKYKANEDLGAVEVRHGSVYMEGGAIYDVGAAVRLGMLEPVDNEIVP